MTLDRQQARQLKVLLGRPIPREYTRALRGLPDGGAPLRAPGLAADELPLFVDGDVIVRQNELVREEDIWTEAGPWPADHIAIGADLSGDRFSFCVTDRQTYRLLHETARFVPLGDLTSFVEAVVGHADDPAALADAVEALRQQASERPAQRPASAATDRRIERLRRKVAAAGSDWDRSYALWDVATACEKAGRIGDALACHDQVIALGAVATIRYELKLGVLDHARYDWKSTCAGYRAAFVERFGSARSYYDELVATWDGLISALEAGEEGTTDLDDARRQRARIVAEATGPAADW